jgi:hypothetical protein
MDLHNNGKGLEFGLAVLKALRGADEESACRNGAQQGLMRVISGGSLVASDSRGAR